MIKIISGAYGYADTDGNVTPKTPKDEPFELSAVEEDRLVRRGVAAYVDMKPAPHDDGRPGYNAGMKLDALKELMSAAGLDSNAVMKKVDAVAALDAYYDGLEEDDNDNDDGDEDGGGSGTVEKPPQLNAENPVA